MGRGIRRDAVAIILVAVASGLVSAFPPFSLAHGWSIDALTALRWEFFGARRDPASTPVAVIAIDEETYQTPPFKGSPTLTWTAEVGRVLNAVIDGGAKAVGFDIVFPTSIEQSEIPFGDDLLGSRMRGFDRAFLRSLATGASAGKVVLGEGSERRSIDPAVTWTTDRGRSAEEYPPAQHIFGSRRCGAASTADFAGRRKAASLDGARTGIART
jgi:adenylate cyclase